MQSLVFPFLLIFSTTCLAEKNALFGRDVLMLGGNYTPAMILVDESMKPIGDLGGTELTYCMNVFLKHQDKKDWYMLHCYATREELKEMYMYTHISEDSSYLNISGVVIKSKYAYFRHITPELDKWTHICFSWKSSTGTVNLYFNGVKVGSRSGVSKGETVNGDGLLVLGQEQYKFGGGFLTHDGMNGRMTQLNAWRRILTVEEVKMVQEGKMYGDLIDWRNSLWSLSGNALVVESEAPNAALQQLVESEQQNSTLQNPVCTTVEEPVEKPAEDPIKESLAPTDLSICLRFNGDPHNQRESFVLFYYKTRSGTPQMSLTINDDKTTSITMGSETRTIPHLTVTPGWHHWCFVWSEETLKVFIDGAMFDSLSEFSNGTMLATDGDLYIHEINSRNRIISNVADFVMWERALSKEEVNDYFMSRLMSRKQPDVSVNKVYYASSSAYFSSQQFPYPFIGYQRPILQRKFPVGY